jgi:hypothetical protein
VGAPEILVFQMGFHAIQHDFWHTETVSELALMPALAFHFPDRKLKASRLKDKDYVLSVGDGLQLRVRSNGSMLWNFQLPIPIIRPVPGAPR